MLQNFRLRSSTVCKRWMQLSLALGNTPLDKDAAFPLDLFKSCDRGKLILDLMALLPFQVRERCVLPCCSWSSE